MVNHTTTSPCTYFVSATTGADTNDGTESRPFRTISAAAAVAKRGDTVRVATGIYRERVDPPRGGADGQPIRYVGSEDGHTIVTGSDVASDWEHFEGNVWRHQIPSARFGSFNPYVDVIRGDWFDPLGRVHHTGCVYRNGHWLIETETLADVKGPAHPEGLWFATVEGDADEVLSFGEIRLAGSATIPADAVAFRYGGELETSPEGRIYSTHLKVGDWLRFDNVDFGDGRRECEIDVAPGAGGGRVELRMGNPDGPLLGHVDVEPEGRAWRTVTVPLNPVAGTHDLVARITTAEYERGTTTIYAQFPEGDPNDGSVEINVRQSVFYPSRNHIDHIHVSGFDLCNAATNWAPPSSEQTAVIGTNWSRGWVIENNTISYSKCSGVSLGKYGDGTDNTNDAGQADPYTRCVRDALENGWNKSTIGTHTVRNNVIHHCEQTGIVGSMGCAFSTIVGNEIYDIDSRRLFFGAEQAGIKFHGAIDTLIADNHIYRCGYFGIWLDWMCQNAQVTGNLLHDNEHAPDLFFEMQHGPLLVANNVLLSTRATAINSKGMAFAHNLLAGIRLYRVSDTRVTPYHRAHSTEIAGLSDSTSGDHRFYNNVFGSTVPTNTGDLEAHDPGWDATIDDCVLPCFAGGNVYASGATASRFDPAEATQPNADINPRLTHGAEGWFLSLGGELPAAAAVHREVVTTELLGRAAIPGFGSEHFDGTPLAVDTDYFAVPRGTNPTPGPIQSAMGWPLKVWPKS